MVCRLIDCLADPVRQYCHLLFLTEARYSEKNKVIDTSTTSLSPGDSLAPYLSSPEHSPSKTEFNRSHDVVYALTPRYLPYVSQLMAKDSACVRYECPFVQRRRRIPGWVCYGETDGRGNGDVRVLFLLFLFLLLLRGRGGGCRIRFLLRRARRWVWFWSGNMRLLWLVDGGCEVFMLKEDLEWKGKEGVFFSSGEKRERPFCFRLPPNSFFLSSFFSAQDHI